MSECPSLVPCDRLIIESTSSFPDDIPSGTAVPHWATLSSAEFDATTAEAAGGKLVFENLYLLPVFDPII